MPQNPESIQSERFGRIAERVFAAWPAEQWTHSDVIVAVSGGPDSVALFRVLHQLIRVADGKGSLTVVHCNHGTRVECTMEAEFVRNLANQRGVDFRQIDRSPEFVPLDESDNSEESLRRFRYRALLSVALETGIRYIATGHTADDQIETILFRLCRGTGIAGLRGIPHQRVQDGITIVRPLLTTRRSEIVEILGDCKQPFCVDDSNRNNSYTRNFLRHEVIPILIDRFGNQFENSLLGLDRQVADHMELLDQLTDQYVCAVRSESGRSANVDIGAIKELHPVLIRHALRRIWSAAQLPQQGMNREKWILLSNLASSESGGTIQLPGNVFATVEDNRLKIVRVPAQT